MEVEESSLHPDGTQRYNPLDKEEYEGIWLNPRRIIPESRLRYGRPKKGEKFWSRYKTGWRTADYELADSYLILDPEPEEKDEWDEWADSAPTCIDDRTKNWIKRMPRREDGTT